VLLAYCNVLSCFQSTFCQEAEKNMIISVRILGILNELETWNVLNTKQEC
jgi:hypothetical protein